MANKRQCSFCRRHEVYVKAYHRSIELFKLIDGFFLIIASAGFPDSFQDDVHLAYNKNVKYRSPFFVIPVLMLHNLAALGFITFMFIIKFQIHSPSCKLAVNKLYIFQLPRISSRLSRGTDTCLFPTMNQARSLCHQSC